MTNLSGKKIEKKRVKFFKIFYYNQGDLTKPLILSSVAAHADKIIQARW